MSEAATSKRPSARALLDRYGLRPKKSWGQNFLVDENAQARIVAAAAVGPDDVVVEIGAGLGALTGRLAVTAAQVIAVERDPDMVHVLEREYADQPRVQIRAMDALDFDFAQARAAAGRPLVVVGNLPYQITSPLLFAIVDAAARGQTVARAVLMVQREFAERMGAPAGDKTYGRLSVMVQQQADVEILFHVGAGCFLPPPAVTSTVLRVVPRPVPRAPVQDDALFATVVRAAFATRRKMLRRSLAAAFDERVVVAALAHAGLQGTRRAEELTVAEFAALANGVSAAQGNGHA